MKKRLHSGGFRRAATLAVAFIVCAGLILAAPDVQANQKEDGFNAKKGAGIGALLGLALGRGNILEDAARGALVGAAAGAITKEVQKGQQAKQQQYDEGRQKARDDYKRSKQEQDLAAREARIAELEKELSEAVTAVNEAETTFIETIGPDNWEGYKALRSCRYDRAIALAGVAATSDDPTFRITSVWLQAMVAVDRADIEGSHAIFNELVAVDPDIDSPQQASITTDQAVLDMRGERRDLGIVCR